MKEDQKKAAAPEAKPAPAAGNLEPLPEGATLKDVIARVNALIDRGVTAKRDRGPTSTREMTPSDAERTITGDLKDLSHAKAAEALGLSYGQVYSARKGFTFKAEYQKGVRAARSAS